MKKAIFFDIDGTLIDCSRGLTEITKEVKKSIRELQSEGNYNISSNIFEIYSKKETKASGIMRVLDFLNIPVENSYAFGDGINDIEMLEAVGCGIAMENASDLVKSHAKKVTCEVMNNGIVVGIEKFIN